MRWGLVPFWAKDIKFGFSNTNRAGGIESKSAFREAFQRRRRLVPVDNFKKTAVWLGEGQRTRISCSRAIRTPRGRDSESTHNHD